jgi:hypothetical protein
MDYVVYDPTSLEIVRWGTTNIEDVSQIDANAVEGKGSPTTHYVLNGAIVAYTAEQASAKSSSPGYLYKWSNSQMTWVDTRDLATAQQQSLDKVKAARDDFLNGGFTWDGSTFDSDDTSQLRLLGLYTAAQDPSYQPEAWRLQDNSWRVLSADDAKNVWNALKQHIQDAFTKFANYETQINATTTNAQADAIVWQ